jgi:hypothetical protein
MNRLQAIALAALAVAGIPPAAPAVAQTEVITGGQAATQTPAAASLSAEDRTALRRVIETQRISPVDDPNLNLSVGATVPTTVVLNPLPLEVTEVLPQFKGHDYFVLANGSIVIVDAATQRIVTVISG